MELNLQQMERLIRERTGTCDNCPNYRGNN